jgi:hypothetical protein
MIPLENIRFVRTGRETPEEILLKGSLHRKQSVQRPSSHIVQFRAVAKTLCTRAHGRAVVPAEKSTRTPRPATLQVVSSHRQHPDVR